MIKILLDVSCFNLISAEAFPQDFLLQDSGLWGSFRTQVLQDSVDESVDVIRAQLFQVPLFVSCCVTFSRFLRLNYFNLDREFYFSVIKNNILGDVIAY